MDLEKLKLVELTQEEKIKTEGGILPIIVALFVLGISLGYADGRRDK